MKENFRTCMCYCCPSDCGVDINEVQKCPIVVKFNARLELILPQGNSPKYAWYREAYRRKLIEEREYRALVRSCTPGDMKMFGFFEEGKWAKVEE